MRIRNGSWSALLLCAAFVHAQDFSIPDFNLDSIAAKATEKAEINLDGPLLQMATQNAPDDLKGKLGMLKRVLVISYKFDKEGQYSESDLEGVRKAALKGAGWTRLLRTKDQQGSAEIYMQSQGGKPAGFLLIAAKPRELAVIHAAGSVELASLQEFVASTIKFDLASAGKTEGN